ncbi:hypothetical protein SMG44B_20637 [Stenotrophomonas maltophilia]|nr:hypothetical protein BN126390072 [Stenotrophomonas maltophilia]
MKSSLDIDVGYMNGQKGQGIIPPLERLDLSLSCRNHAATAQFRAVCDPSPDQHRRYP